MSASDEAVRATNDDAASCKRSAVQLGYWSDPYIQFVTKASERKPPEISRGYYARVKGMQGLVHQFLDMTEGECQVINLGVGSDTWYWNMVDEQKAPKKAWVEVDFSEVTAKKLYQIKSHKQLLEKIQSPGKLPCFGPRRHTCRHNLGNLLSHNRNGIGFHQLSTLDNDFHDELDPLRSDDSDLEEFSSIALNQRTV